MILTECPSKERRAGLKQGEPCAVGANQCCAGSPWWDPGDPIQWRCINAQWTPVCDVRICGTGTCRPGEKVCGGFVECPPPDPPADFAMPPDG